MNIVLKNICKSYDEKCVFEKISGKINQKDKIGIVGINGVGKTTLLNIILGKEDMDSGEIYLNPQDLKIGYLSQQSILNKELTVYENMYKDLIDYAEDNYKKKKYEIRIKNLIKDMGLSESDFNKKVSSLSGGEKTKVSLLKVILEEPEVLFLDEPTNHLDIDSIKWLENFIKKIDKTVVIISHDREFLDNTVNKIFHLTSNYMKEYSGNYTKYKIERENEIKNQEKQYCKQQSEIKHLKEVINDRKTWFNKAHKAAGQNDFARRKAKKHVSVMRAKEKQLGRIEKNKVKKPKEEIYASFEILNKNSNMKKKNSKFILEATDIRKRFNNKVLFEKVSFRVQKDDKIGIVGKNGSGKSTLLKILIKEELSEGNVYVNPSLNIGYFSQQLENLNCENTILEETLEEDIDLNSARLMLACFLFKNNDINKKIKVLSMGEKCRVAFVKLIVCKADLIILDEPTNYMDIISREKVEDMIELFKGAVIVVSHDRYFIKKVSNRIFEIEKGKINIYNGDYKYYIQKKIENKKKKSTGRDVSNILDNIRVLECKIAYISGRLDDDTITQKEKEELNVSFLEISKKINEYRKIIK